MMDRLAALSTELDLAGHPDIADRLDAMSRSAALFNRPLLTAPIRGFGKAITWSGQHPLAAAGIGAAGLVGSHYMDHDQPGLDDALRRSWEDVKELPGRVGRAYRGFMFSGPRPGQEIEPPTRRPGAGGPPMAGMPVGTPQEPAIPGYIGQPTGNLQAMLPGAGYDPNEPIQPGMPVQDYSYAEGVAGVPVGGGRGRPMF